MLRIAIVDPSDSTRDPLRTLLLGVDFVWLEAECARYEFFFDVIQPVDARPGRRRPRRRQGQGAAVIGQLSAEYPELPILAISRDHQALLQSLQQRGQVLPHPARSAWKTCSARLRRAAERGRAVRRRRAPTTAGQAEAPGRSPSSARAAASAAPASRSTSAPRWPPTRTTAVALIDLDLALGDADVALDLMADYTWPTWPGTSSGWT